MFEKVNPSHPDKIADRIAGALVDYAYTQESNPRVAVEVLIGHGVCHIISETSVHFPDEVVNNIVNRLAGLKSVIYNESKQDAHLASNQSNGLRCGDNGIFKGVPVTVEQKVLASTARHLYEAFPFDGKYIISDRHLIICQSNADVQDIIEKCKIPADSTINPLGYWTGGTDVDTGATNRKLGSDMGDAVTGGGLHGKDLSKADVSVNIYAHLKAQQEGSEVKLFCAIGDDTIDGRPYSEIVDIVRTYVERIGGFEKLAEWGLVR